MCCSSQCVEIFSVGEFIFTELFMRFSLRIYSWINTGKSFSGALILASNNYNMTTDCSWNYHENYKHRTWVEHVLTMFCACSFNGNSMNNLLSYCGLIDTKIRASDKDLPVHM